MIEPGVHLKGLQALWLAGARVGQKLGKVLLVLQVRDEGGSYQAEQRRMNGFRKYTQ